MKNFLKKIIPTSLVKPLLPLFHRLQSVFWNARFGWPARGMNVIAITGTNGKTTTVAFVGKILERNGFTVGISSTAFYQIDNELTVNDTNMTVTDPARHFRLMRRMKRAGVDWIVLEVTSHSLHQYRVAGTPFTVAAMTNLTQDHLDYHGSMDAYAEAKSRLFKAGAKWHVLNRDDEWFHYYEKFQPKDRTYSYGTDKDADCRIVAAKLGPTSTKLEIKLERSLIKPKLKLVGKFNAYNALCAATIGHALGIEPKLIKEGLEAIESVPGRMEVIDHKESGVKVVVDYAHTPDALENVLETLRGISRNKVITVFGATGDRDKSKRPLMGKIAARLSNIVVVTDDDPYTENPINIRSELLDGAYSVVDGAEVFEVGERRSAIEKAIELAKRGDVILLAGIGHQKYRVIGQEKIEWSEKAVAEEILAKQ